MGLRPCYQVAISASAPYNYISNSTTNFFLLKMLLFLNFQVDQHKALNNVRKAMISFPGREQSQVKISLTDFQ
jgi:hypothetical protein